jgi:hypothetical protein
VATIVELYFTRSAILWALCPNRITDSSFTNAASFSSARTTKRFPSSRCASMTKIVRPCTFRSREYPIGLVEFEPTACRRGDRSTVPYRARLYLARSCNIAPVVLLWIGWRSFRCGLKSTAFHASLPWNRQRCGGEYAQSNSRKSLRSGVRFFGCAIRNNKTLQHR